MTRLRILKYIINPVLFLTIHMAKAQTSDTVPGQPHRLTIGAGYDIGKKMWSRFQHGNIDEIHLNFSRDNHSLSIFYGVENMPYATNRYRFQSTGRYFKIEYAYNFFENWGNMHNEINVGLRYAKSHFDYHIIEIQIINPRNPSEELTYYPRITLPNLHAQWLELTANIKVEILPRLYVELYISGKRFLSGTKPENFDLIYIPGFYQTNISGFGFGLGYGIAYHFGL